MASLVKGEGTDGGTFNSSDRKIRRFRSLALAVGEDETRLITVAQFIFTLYHRQRQDLESFLRARPTQDEKKIFKKTKMANARDGNLSRASIFDVIPHFRREVEAKRTTRDLIVAVIERSFHTKTEERTHRVIFRFISTFRILGTNSGRETSKAKTQFALANEYK